VHVPWPCVRLLWVLHTGCSGVLQPGGGGFRVVGMPLTAGRMAHELRVAAPIRTFAEDEPVGGRRVSPAGRQRLASLGALLKS
jgi:hypothetical protein